MRRRPPRMTIASAAHGKPPRDDELAAPHPGRAPERLGLDGELPPTPSRGTWLTDRVPSTAAAMSAAPSAKGSITASSFQIQCTRERFGPVLRLVVALAPAPRPAQHRDRGEPDDPSSREQHEQRRHRRTRRGRVDGRRPRQRAATRHRDQRDRQRSVRRAAIGRARPSPRSLRAGAWPGFSPS